MATENQTHLINKDEISSRAVAVGGYIKDAGDTIRNAGDYCVRVISGYHTGAEVRSKPGELTVGSGKDNDLVLFADDVSEHHVQISLPSNLLGKVRITPIEQNITLEDGSVVQVGQYADIDGDESFEIGSAELEVIRIGNPKQYARPAMRVLAFVCLIAMIPFLYGVFSGMVTGAVGAGSVALKEIRTQISNVSDGYLNTSYGNSSSTLTDSYIWTARTKLEELQLNHRLRVSKSGHNSLRISGTIMDQEVQSWNAFLRWYDSKNGFPSLIRDVRRTKVDNDLPKIKSVWLDDKPTVFFRDGTTANVGSKLNAGWKVISIGETSVTIERDGATISLTY